MHLVKYELNSVMCLSVYGKFYQLFHQHRFFFMFTSVAF